MFARLLRLVSIGACALVVVSFVLFAHDQVSGASKAQVTSLDNGRSIVRGQAPAHHSGQPRRFIDDAAHALTAPFRLLVSGNSAWAVWISSTLLALLIYGAGLGFAARFARLGRL